MKISKSVISIITCLLLLIGLALLKFGRAVAQTNQSPNSGAIVFLPTMLTPPEYTPIVNAPHFSGDIDIGKAAISWFGNITANENYADVRIGYNNELLKIHVLIFDRRLWFDQTPTVQTLTDWDALRVYLDLNGNTGSQPDADSYRFTGQLTWGPTGENSKSTALGNGTGWTFNSIPFEEADNWRGNAPNDDVDDRGWWISFEIPFSSLGLSGPPPEGTVWGLGLRLFDRDDSSGSSIPVKSWPEAVDPLASSTWGQLRFGIPVYTPPAANSQTTIQIRQGLNGASVPDGHVGGRFDCGTPYLSNLFTGWGNANYAGDHQVNIQNQWDVADWPCFSKYLVTFPITAIPQGKVILSAQLTMNEFGNSGQDQQNPVPDSFIQVLTLQTGWSESTVTWNNTPSAWENYGGIVVPPVVPPGSGPYTWDWDVSRAVADAYAQNIPLRLVLYSADMGQHSGKYFIGSDAGSGGANLRPTLTVTYGD